MKNTKLIALVAVLLVVSVVVSVVISTSGNKDYSEIIDAMKQETQTQIDALAQANKDLQNKLDKAEQSNKDLQDEIADLNDKLESEVNSGNVSAEDFEAATAALQDQIKKLAKAIVDYKDETNDLGEPVLDTTLYWNWDASAEVLRAAAENSLNRAISVEQQDKIVADFTAAIRVIPNQVEELLALVASIEENGATYEDYKAVDKIIAYDMFNDVNVELFEGEDNTAKTKALNDLKKKYDALYEDFQDSIKDHFVALVDALPSVDNVKLTDTKAWTEAAEYYYYVTNDHGVACTKGAAKKAVTKLGELADRLEVLEDLKEEADLLNEVIKTAFDGKKFVLNTATLDIIEGLEEAINELFYGSLVYQPGDADYDAEDPDRNDDGWNELYDINLNPNSSSCNTYIYNFVNVAAVEAYRAKYEGLKEDLKAQAKVFYDAVKAYEDVESLQSYLDAEKAATNAYSAILTIVGLDQINDVDKLLGNTTEDDKIEMVIGGVEVEVFPFAGHKTVYNAILTEVGTIKTAVKTLADFNTIDLRDVVCTVANHVADPDVALGAGQKHCDCASNIDENSTFGALNKDLYKAAIAAGKFDASVRALKTLMTTYEFTATEILGAHYDNYLEVAAKALKDEAYAAIEASTTIADADKAGCKTMVDTALANGVVFEVEFVEDTNDNDIQDPSEYDWAGATKTLFGMLKSACGANVQPQ